MDLIFNDKSTRDIRLLAERSFGSVFIVKDNDRNDTIYKRSLIGFRYSIGVIQPIDGSKFIISHLINSVRLSHLKSIPQSKNYSNFANVLDNIYVFENKNQKNIPDVRTEYLITKQSFGGQPLNHVIRMKPEVCLSIISQIVVSIAVAENELHFEHRDLHLGNVLFNKTDKPFGYYTINGNDLTIPLNGIQIVIIDTTFSRSKKNKKIIFNDLSDNYNNIDNYNDLEL